MEASPLVSIVIPVYNGANYVGEAIESALAQTWPNLEVIVVNDGSTDGGETDAVVARFGNRVRYLSKPNGGVASALNHAISNMRGEFFSWLSHDDLYKPEKVARQVAAWRQFGKPCIVIGDVDVMDGAGNHLWSYGVGAANNLVARPLDAIFKALINGCALLVPRILFDSVGQFETGLPTTQDYQLWYRMARVVPFVHCAWNDVRQRIHPEQSSHDPIHLTEGGRMFIHLLHETPIEVMTAYSGSELKFLHEVRSEYKLGGYPGLWAYVEARMDRLIAKIPYTLVVSSASAVHNSYEGWTHPPSAVLLTQADLGKQTLHAAAVFALGHVPQEANVRAALRALLPSGAQIAIPAERPSLSAPLLGVAAVRAAVPALLANPTDALLGHTVTYEAPQAWPAPSEEDVAKALKGTCSLLATSTLSPAALAVHIQTSAGRTPHLLVCDCLDSEPSPALRAWIETECAKARVLIMDTTEQEKVRLVWGADFLAGEGAQGGLIYAAPTGLSDVNQLIKALQTAPITLWPSGDPRSISFDVIAQSPFRVFIGDYRIIRNSTLLGSRFREAIASATEVSALGDDLAERIRSLLPHTGVTAIPPWPKLLSKIKFAFRNRTSSGEPVRIAMPASTLRGAKTCDLVMDVVRLVAARRWPLCFHILGELNLPEQDLEDTEEVLAIHRSWTPAVPNNNVLLGAIDPHLAWFPLLEPDHWFEEIKWAGDSCLPISGSAIGSIAQQCAGRSSTWLFPPTANAEEWISRLLQVHALHLHEGSTGSWMPGPFSVS